MTIIISNSSTRSLSICPTEISEETVLTSATASECATASASVTMATSRPTRTLAKKVNCSSLIFGFDTNSNGHPIDNGNLTSALRLVNF